MQLNPHFTFDRFVITPGAAVAHRACWAFAETRPTAPRLIGLYGRPGVGKTHLLHSIGNAVIDRAPATHLALKTAEELRDEFVRALRQDRLDERRREYRQLDVLLIDDLHVLGGRPDTQSEIARTLISCLESGVRIACAGMSTPAQVKALSTPLKSLPNSRFIGIKSPTLQALRRILRSSSVADGLAIPAMAL
ncbi:MAG TPA: DnaA/Hda family protein, partial [Candidatus Binatia bacterium]